MDQFIHMLAGYGITSFLWDMYRIWQFHRDRREDARWRPSD